MKEKKCIGWEEYISLPSLGIRKIKIKIDSGAKTSSLHADDIEIYKKRGVSYVRCKIPLTTAKDSRKKKIDQKVIDFRKVRSSNGVAEIRPVINAEAKLFGEFWEIQLTLTDRSLMGFPMLLGREAMKGRFIIDPSKSFLADKKTKKKVKK